MNFDKIAKSNFKQAFSNHREALLSKLSELFSLPILHPIQVALTKYYNCDTEIKLDKEYAAEMLKLHVGKGEIFIIDASEIRMGGFKINNPTQYDFYGGSAPYIEQEKNWENFVRKIKIEYWKDEERNKSFQKLSDFNLREHRERKSLYEQVLSDPSNNYKPLNLKGFKKYYLDLITKFYSYLQYQPKVSNAKNKRYAKNINSEVLFGMLVRIGNVETELKRGHLEFPKIDLEIFTKELSKHISDKIYLTDQQEFPIGRVGFSNFFTNMFDSFRIGTDSIPREEEELKKDIYFYLDVHSQIFKIYVDHIEEVLINES